MDKSVKSLILSCGVALAAGIASATDENLIAFWDFRGGVPGESVSTLKNSSGVKTYTGTPWKLPGNIHAYPTYSDDIPGRIYASNDIVPENVYLSNPQSLHFGRDTNESNVGGGYIDIAGLAGDLSGRTSYTIEFFVKPEHHWFPWVRILQYYTTAGETAALFYGNGTGQTQLKLYVNGSSKCGPTVTAIGQWYHVAFVYSETDSSAHVGSISYYLDHVLQGTATGVNAATFTETFDAFRLGTVYGEKAGQPAYCFHGCLSALRISGEALPVGKMLYKTEIPPEADEMFALFDFKDDAVGTAANSVTNKGTYALQPGVGFAADNKDSGLVPVYSDDVPGRYIFASRDAKTPLITDPQSLKFTTAGEPTSRAEASVGVGGGYIRFDKLGSIIGTCESYTIEMFVKDEDWSEWQWTCGACGWGLGGTSHRSLTLPSVKAGKSDWSTTFNGSTCVKSSTWKDGRWHHVAMVHDGTSHSTTLYVDYKAGTTASDRTNDYVSASTFYLGIRGDVNKSYAFHGKIACVRMTASALGVEDFMCACNIPEEMQTVFSWNFEEGRNKIGTKISEKDNTPLNPYSAYTFGWVYKFLDSSKPEWSDKVSGKKIVKWGETVVHTNETAMHLCGLHSATDAEKTAQKNLTGYAGTVLARFGSDSVILEQNPKSWTLEGYFKMEYTDETIPMPGGSTQTWAYPWSFFGKAGCPTAYRSGDTKTPQTSWGLTVSPTVRSWCLTWTEDDGKVDPASEDPGTGGVSHSKTFEGTAEVLDKRWHHVAVTYDADKKQFELFVDHISKGTAAVGTNGPLWDGPYDICFGRGVGGQTNLEGWMDEIRFSNKVLTPEEMVRLEAVPGLLILLR